MPQPKSPVVHGLDAYEIIYGEGQDHVVPLPALRSKGPNYEVYSRWELTAAERMEILRGADIFTVQQTFGNPFQPTKVIITHPSTNEADKDQILETLGLSEELDERLLNLLDKAFKS